MKRKFFLALAISFFVTLILPVSTLAQEYSCMWVEHLPGVGNCEPVGYCPSGFHPRIPCANISSSECDGSHPCDPNPTPTPTLTPVPVPPGGECGCIFNSWTLSCEDKTPSDCSSGLICSCPPDIEVGTGIAVGCFSGTCIAPITPTPPGEGVPLRVQPTPCSVAGDPEGGIETALGCIPTKNTSRLAGWILARAMAIGGGVAFLLMLWAGIQIITSAGDPQKLQAGKELLTSAITGLLMILFAAFLLQLIGVQILSIPGFGG